MRYKKLTGIILKKTNYREADQIVTVWTKEEGKVRCLARGLRKPSSKLVYSLQDFSIVNLEITGKNFPTLISASPQRQFGGLQRELRKAAAAFYAAELMLKITADENPNAQAYDLLAGFLEQLENASADAHMAMVDEFALKLVRSMGFGSPQTVDSHQDVTRFIEQLIERKIKSEPFLISM